LRVAPIRPLTEPADGWHQLGGAGWTDGWHRLGGGPSLDSPEFDWRVAPIHQVAPIHGWHQLRIHPGLTDGWHQFGHGWHQFGALAGLTRDTDSIARGAGVMTEEEPGEAESSGGGLGTAGRPQAPRRSPLRGRSRDGLSNFGAPGDWRMAGGR